jgi:hypothetical protein
MLSFLLKDKFYFGINCACHWSHILLAKKPNMLAIGTPNVLTYGG